MAQVFLAPNWSFPHQGTAEALKESWNQLDGLTGPSEGCIKGANAPHGEGILKYLYKTTCLSKGLQDELRSGREEEEEEEEERREW